MVGIADDVRQEAERFGRERDPGGTVFFEVRRLRCLRLQINSSKSIFLPQMTNSRCTTTLLRTCTQKTKKRALLQGLGDVSAGKIVFETIHKPHDGKDVKIPTPASF